MEKQQASSEDVYIRDKIQTIFEDYIIPLNILPFFRKYSEHVLVTRDHDHVKASVAKGGDSLGATELLHRLYRYKGWYQCLLSVLRDDDVKMSHVAQMMEDALAPRKNPISKNFSRQKREFNFLLIGKTGSGKSATGNSILQVKKFTTSSLTNSGTQEVQVAEGEIGDYKFTVVDCPGVGDSSLDNLKDTEKLCGNMEKAMSHSGGGFHVLLLVLKYGNKYTHDEQEAIKKFKAIFGENIVRDFCIIIMTHGENFDMEVADPGNRITFRDWLSQQTGAFQDLLQECGSRCALFYNNTTCIEYKKSHTKNLLSLVQDMMCKDVRYTSEHFARAEKQRIKLLVESKKPYLKKNISERISELSDELDHLQETSLSGKIQALQTLKKEAEEILSEIDEEDQGTRTLDDLRKNIINFHKRVEKKIEKQVKALERQQPDGTVSTSEAHGAFQLSTNSVSVEEFGSKIKCSAWNPKGDLLAVGCADATARIWNMGEHTDGLENLLTLDHKDRGSPTTSHITSLDWASDGTYLATSCSEGVTKIWTRDGNLIKTFGQNEGSIDSVKWSRGGTYILTTARKASWVVTVYDAKKGSCVQKFLLDSGHWDGCFVDWQSDNTFASRVDKRCINIYSTGAQTPVKTLKGHTLIINDIKWDPQGQLLASCSDDETVKIWDMKNDQQIHDLLGHSDGVYGIKWSPTGPGTDNPNQNLILASTSYDDIVCLWDVECGTCLHQLAQNRTETFMKVAFSPDGRYIAVGNIDGIFIRNVQTGSLTHRYRINEPKGRPSILDMYWTHGGDKLVAPTINGPVSVCDVRMVMPHRQLDS